MKRLAVTPSVIEFDSSENFELESYLSNMERSSAIDSIASARDIILDKGGRTESSQHRYTTTALSEVCRNLCPGLWRVILELSDLYSNTHSISNSSTQTAISIFNTAVNERFESKLYDRQIVANSNIKTYDGILGPSYFYLSNSSMFENLTDIAGSQGLDLISASIVGRRVSFCFAWPQELITLTADGSENIYKAGVLISNDETGEAAVRGKHIWLRSPENLKLPRKPFTSRLIHAGRNFDKKLNNILKRLTVEPSREDVIVFEQQIARLSKIAVKMLPEDVDSSTETRERLDRLLLSKGLTKQLGDKVIQDFARQGSDNNCHNGLLVSIGAKLRKKTAYDLLVSVMRQSNRAANQYKELLDKAAYNLYTSKK